MSSSSTMSTFPMSDLRSDAKSYKRDKDHNSKWARGPRSAAGKNCTHHFTIHRDQTCEECVGRPAHRDGSRNHSEYYYNRTKKLANNVLYNPRGSASQRKASRNGLNSDTGSSDEEVVDQSAAPIPDADIMYSYDARSGPSTGNDILSNAVMQAVKRFENKQTEQLIKTEYDLVLDGKEMEDAYAGDAEDDFEMIEYEHVR